MNKVENNPRVFGIIGWKNTGKTHLVARLVAALVKRGYRVATIKHAHHSFDIDHKGRDSYRHRMAGASQVMVVSESRFALMGEGLGEGGVPDLSTLLAKLEPTDFVLLEGFKTAPLPKMECYRGGADKESAPQNLLAQNDKTIVGIASDTDIKNPPCEVLDLNDAEGLCDFIIKHTSPNKSPAPKKSTMPKGVDWTAVADVLDGLKTRLTCTLPSEQIPTANAGGRILSADITASQANPPFANSAVDGFGFAQASLSKSKQTTLTLTENHATAGAVIDSPVGAGLAIPILTGAPLPAGVECVVLQESVTKTGGKITFPSAIKHGANTRAKGEDIAQGAKIFAKGHRITPQDLAVLCATGVATVPVYRPLRVGVLSSGDEVIAIGQPRTPAQIYDANQPMLLDILRKWGYHAVALGRVQDSAESVAKALSSAAAQVDAIITTGGASTGDKDHIAAVLKSRGTLHDWRIAMKPGRPLALADWQGVPVFALPGNPVASFVCALIFARPALGILSGQGWLPARGFALPARFCKSKQGGRREYLRARMVADADGAMGVCVFASEGSGKISGLSWADGLVELPDEAMDIREGDLVMFYPFGMFGL